MTASSDVAGVEMPGVSSECWSHVASCWGWGVRKGQAALRQEGVRQSPLRCFGVLWC